MGLLDDAIREHLELKLQNGGDPGEIAREEREALEPVVIDSDGAEEELDEVTEHTADTAAAPPSTQDTAEFDMTAVLEPADDDEPLEWEEPGSDDEPPREIPGQEHLSFE